MTPLSAAAMAWDAAGRPSTGRPVDDHPARCLVCAAHAPRTTAAKAALGGNYDLVSSRHPTGTRVCEACSWALAGKPPRTLRMWTVLVAPGVDLGPNPPGCWVPTAPGLRLANRADPRPLTRLLTRPPAGPWAAAVAVSGHKHTLPYTPVNPGGPGPWTVRVESGDALGDPDRLDRLLHALAVLRAHGHRGDDLARARPTPAAFTTPASLAAWRAHAHVIDACCPSPLADLAAWALTKETVHDHTAPRGCCPG